MKPCFTRNALLWSAFAGLGGTLQAQDAVPPWKASFETAPEIAGARLNHASAQLVEQGASDGKKALGITFNPPATYPSFSFPIAEALDWRGSGALAFEVTNPGDKSAPFALRIDSALNSDGKSNSRTFGFRVQPGQTVTCLMPFNAERQNPDYSKMPGYTLMSDFTGGWNPFSLKNIVAMQIFSHKPAAPVNLIFDNFRLVPALPAVAKAPLRADTRELLSFENAADLTQVVASSASSEVTGRGASAGKQALSMTFDPPATYPNVVFKPAAPLDLQGYGGLAFDLTNPEEETASFGIRLDSVATFGTGAAARQGGGSVEGGQTVSFILPFGTDPTSLGMKSLPGFANFRTASGAGNPDLSQIAAWQIYMVRPARSRKLIVDNFRVVPGQNEDFTNMVDRYGQYTRGEWPGKVKAEGDFAAQKTTELADIAAHPPLAQFNKFGGWAAGPQLKATGFFRTEKYQGKWSLVDPEGRLFFSVGVDTIGPNQTTKLSGREDMFTVTGKEDPILAKYSDATKGTLDFMGANLERKYGADFGQPWLDHTYSRLRSWGFNTVGAFSSWNTLANGRVPYTATVWPGAGHARIPFGKPGGKNMDDPFDPRFQTSVTNAARPQASRIKDDPYFIGYFVGNEEALGHYRSGPRNHYGLILGAFALKAEASPAKRAFLEQMRAKYGVEVSALNTVWGTSFQNWEALNEPFELKDPLSEATQKDLSLLLQSFADQYFRSVQAGLKAVSPNNLYLGCRFAGYGPEYLSAATRYADVVSFNIYRTRIDAGEYAILDAYDHPVIIGEFHFGAADRGVFDVGLVGVADQAARGKEYRNYIRSVLEHPKFVGAHWFQYADQPTTGRTMDGENGNVGFVSITDTPYPELIAAARQTHAEMYAHRYGPAK